MKMDSRTYDILKYIAQVVLPALGTLYFALASIWGFPYGEEIRQLLQGPSLRRPSFFIRK